MIYASNGRNGIGGLDLYYSVLSEENWSEPIALENLNSESDDFGLVIHSKEEVGYFTSNRADGMGSDDIYKVEF